MDRDARLQLIAYDLTEILCDRTKDPAEYIAVLTAMLGIAVAGLARAKDEDEFAAMLARTVESTAKMAINSRERLKEEDSDGEWVSVH